MAAPTILGAKAYYSGGYATTLSSTSDPIDFGSSAGRWVHVTVLDNNSAINITGVTLGGNAMTAEAQVSTPLSFPGNGRVFTMIGDGGSNIPTGVATITATVSSSDFITMNVVWGYGATTLGASTHTAQAATGGVASWTVSGTSANDMCIVSGFETAQTVAGGATHTAPYVTIAGSSGSTLALHKTPTVSGHLHCIVANEVGAASSTTLGMTTTSYQYTPGVGAWAFKVTGAAPTGPTIDTQPTAQTANEGATATFTVAATSSGGTMHYAWERQPPGGGAFASVGTDSNSYTTSSLDCATDHLAQLRVTVSDDNGPTVSNAVGLTVRSVTTISRPGADVTDNGWTASTGSDLFAMIDETTASTADYIESPALSASPEWNTIELKYPLPAGDRIVDAELYVTSGTGTLKIRFVNDAGSVMGTAADQAVTSTPTIYSLPVTLSGPATRVEIAAVL